MVLSRKEILTRMDEFNVSHKRNLVITPLLCKDRNDIFDADSVDLRLALISFFQRR